MILPWEDHRAALTPDEYERQVVTLLAALGRDLPGFNVEHQERVVTQDGAFRFDAVARFTQLGVDFTVLVECKDHVRPVEREDVQVLADKLRSTSAHKGILFSTNGFQRGAIEYAEARGIALVRFVEGRLTYETKARRQPGEPRPEPPPWANIQPFVAYVISWNDGGVTCSLAEEDRTDPLVDFIGGAT
ncbi:MAG TPA: restriction endonuclease [Gemmatimonadaceae bacterium]|nr:restriction endonuclease [Gemmatimonadaceae bacterium]